MQCVLAHTAHYCTVCIIYVYVCICIYVCITEIPSMILEKHNCLARKCKWWRYSFPPFPSIWRNIRHVELCNSVNSQIQQNPPKQCDYSNPRENYSVFSIDFHFPLLTYAEIIARLAKYHSNKATFKAGPSSVTFVKGQVHEIFFLQVSNPFGSFFHML